MTFRTITLMFALLSGTLLQAQSDSLFKAVKGGEVSGYWRNFFMATDNQSPYQDWYSFATGGLLKYESGSYHGFQVGAGFYYTQQIVGNLDERDETTNRQSRYEVGLYDFNNRQNVGFPLLGEVFLKYSHKKHQVQFGRFKLKSPFLNPQDGRMIPTLEQGIWYKFKASKKLQLQAGWLSHIGARSTSEFMAVGRSIGSYPLGLNPDGSRAEYKDNLSSAGMAILSLNYQSSNWGVKFWNYYVENIFNSAFIEPSYSFTKKEVKHKISAQYLLQNQLNEGGDSDYSKRYFHADKSMTMGAQYKVSTPKKWEFSGNWNYITDHGRYMFPREWGREFLFTFQKRERLEGFGDAHAWMIDAKKSKKLKSGNVISAKLGYGQYYRQDVSNAAMNKYAIPANGQFNVDLFFLQNPNKKGFVVEFLAAYKHAIGNTYNDARYIINKVDMVNYNLVLNYNF